ncbi:hypothetical protein C1S70_31490, partial (plasmid) [Azospirillum argentinense]
DQRFDDRPQGVANKRGCHALTNRSQPVLLRTLIPPLHPGRRVGGGPGQPGAGGCRGSIWRRYRLC